MKRTTFLCFAAGLLTSLMAVGCQSPGMITRGQSPAPFPETAEIQQTSHASPHEKKQAFVDAVRDHYDSMHNTSTTYHSEAIHVQANCQEHGGCPSGNCQHGDSGAYFGGGAYCPPGGYCPSPGLCPTGGCRGCGNHLNHYPTHHVSQSYSVPNDLRWPAQNSIGGAVVYPYYTHKGPSDFFRAE